MPSLERFFPPIARFFDTNIRSLPNSRLYFFRANSTTLKATFKDKVGEIPHANPVEADANGLFPPIFLSGLYRVELRSKDNIVQPGWPVDNVGQDSAIVPFAPWSEIVTYQTDDVVTSPDGFWFRSTQDSNLGLDPDENSGESGPWELIVIPIASNFTSDADWISWSDDGTQLSLNINTGGLSDGIGLRTLLTDEDDLHDLPALDSAGRVARYYWLSSSQPSNVPVSGGGYAERVWFSSDSEKITANLSGSDSLYVATKDETWGDWVIMVNGDREVASGRGLSDGGNLSEDRTINTYRRLTQLTGEDSSLSSNFDGVFWYSSATTSHVTSIQGQSIDEGATETVLICREDSDFNLIIEALGTTIVWSFDESISAHQYQIKPGEIVRLVKVDTDSYVAYADNGISQVVELGGQFDAGEEVICRRVGGDVTISGATGGQISHPSGSIVNSSTGAIPQLFRPYSTGQNIYGMDGDAIRGCTVTSTGVFRTYYRDYAGAQYADTGTGDTPCISYPAV